MSNVREQILNEVSPTNVQLADRSKILALGDEAVPVLIDLFLNPSTPYGTINQATLADALIEFSKQKNDTADEFIRKIAIGSVTLSGAYGSTARQIVQDHFEWIGVDPSVSPTKPPIANKENTAFVPKNAEKTRAMAVMRVLIAIVRADRVIDEREKRMLRDFASKLGITREEVQALASQKAVVSVADLPSDTTERQSLLTDAFSVALADGAIARQEHSVIEQLAKGLGVGAEDLESCLRTAREKTGTRRIREYAVPERWCVHDVASFPADFQQLDQLKSQLVCIYQKNHGRVVFDLTHLASEANQNYSCPSIDLDADETKRSTIWEEMTILPMTIQRSTRGRDESWPRPRFAVAKNSHIHTTMTTTGMDMFCDLIVVSGDKSKPVTRPTATSSQEQNSTGHLPRKENTTPVADANVAHTQHNPNQPRSNFASMRRKEEPIRQIAMEKFRDAQGRPDYAAHFLVVDAECERLIREDPADPDPYLILGRALADQTPIQNRARAMELFKKALALDPLNSYARDCASGKRW